MSRLWSVFGSSIFFIIAPGTVAGLVPWAITDWRLNPPFLGEYITRWIGIGLIVLALWPLAISFIHFALYGQGTPAPILPPTRLVVRGHYRHVRNPMYCAVLVIVLGQFLVFADFRLLIWALLFGLGCHLFVTLYEEPSLARKFGADYDRYRANVPRWLPRLSAWTAPEP